MADHIRIAGVDRRMIEAQINETEELDEAAILAFLKSVEEALLEEARQKEAAARKKKHHRERVLWNSRLRYFMKYLLRAQGKSTRNLSTKKWPLPGPRSTIRFPGLPHKWKAIFKESELKLEQELQAELDSER
jgi:hypothetical protein